MTTDPASLSQRDVRRRFERAAASFDGADFVHRAAFEGLLERLAPMLIEPAHILDLGCATGKGSRQLARTYRGARVTAMDRSAGMLRAARRRQRMFSRVRLVQGDACCMPLQAGSVDLVVANLLLPWIDDLPACFSEICRVLKKGGLLVFATLGPGSLQILRDAWHAADGDGLHVHTFPDMHVIGDALVKAGLADPVVDIDAMNVTYRDSDALFADLAACGARNSLANRRAALTGKGRVQSLRSALQARVSGGLLALGLELVFGHAWGSGPRPPAGEFHLPADAIRRRSRN